MYEYLTPISNILEEKLHKEVRRITGRKENPLCALAGTLLYTCLLLAGLCFLADPCKPPA